MIPPNLHWAFEQGHHVQTPAGKGKLIRRRLADLVLPFGQVSTGYPGDNLINQPNPIQPRILPGTYPVFISVVRNKGGGAVAFVTVCFTQTRTVSWEAVGKFFTDSGDGCIFDASVTDLLRKRRNEMPREEWRRLKAESLQGGDGNLVLDEKSGVNAIVFRTCDWSYNCFLGRDHRGNISCLVVDGRIQSEGENLFARLFKLFF